MKVLAGLSLSLFVIISVATPLPPSSEIEPGPPRAQRHPLRFLSFRAESWIVPDPIAQLARPPPHLEVVLPPPLLVPVP